VALTKDDNILHAPVKPLPALPQDALDRLARLHAESNQASHLARLLRNSVHAASLFMLMGSCVLLMGGGTIDRNFFWAVSILAGVVGLITFYIRTNAVAFDRAPFSVSARNVRATLLYLGAAWGAGAFLVLPPALPALEAVLFAVIPALLLAWLLNDARGLAAFQVPAGFLTIGAAFIQSWPDAGLDALAILGAHGGLFAAIAWRRRNPLPAGLALR
jgi:hypothetical protein